MRDGKATLLKRHPTIFGDLFLGHVSHYRGRPCPEGGAACVNEVFGGSGARSITEGGEPGDKEL